MFRQFFFVCFFLSSLFLFSLFGEQPSTTILHTLSLSHFVLHKACHNKPVKQQCVPNWLLLTEHFTGQELACPLLQAESRC